MCGAIQFEFDNISEEELLKFFEPGELAAFRKMGFAESAFWARRPVLPALQAQALHLYDWGNREKNVDLPKTGWAKNESLEAGRWNHLHPKEIEIPAERGCEKKVWFDIAGSIAGALVEKNGVVRAYMITVPSSEDYQSKTGHDRMPKLVKGAIKFRGK
jgi:hypothetical protein